MYCGMELNNPNQKICESCGKEIPVNNADKKSKKEPTQIRDNYKELIIRKRRSWHCC